MFDASCHGDLIGRSHSCGSGMPPAFLDIVVAFALFCRSAINLLLLSHYLPTLDFDFLTRAQSHYLGVILTQIYTIVRLVTEVRGHRQSNKSRLTVSLIYKVWLYSWF